MNRVRRLSMKLIEEFPDRFYGNYEKNKEVLAEVALIRNKRLRNEIAGFLTSSLSESKTAKEPAKETSE